MSAPDTFVARLRARIEKAVESFSATERIVFGVAVVLFITTGLLTLWDTNNHYLVQVPEAGGTLTEGIVGAPRFINPVIALSDTDRDMTNLVYSGLLSFTSDGTPVPDLAYSYNLSEDGRTYSFTIRDNARFHDGSLVTADDVEFTIQKIQDSAIKSPKRAAWEGVIVNKKNDHEISFTLRQPYAPFIENLSIGILPKHLWQGVSNEEFAFSNLNTSPVGSGPYKVHSVKRDSLGLPTSYELTTSKTYALGAPFVKYIVTKFYQNETDLVGAYKRGDIDSMGGISPENIGLIDTSASSVTTINLSRIFAVFFNQNQASVFVNKEVRQALNVALDRTAIVTEVLGGFGSPAYEPLLGENETGDTTHLSATDRINMAIDILTKNGWAVNDKTGLMEKKTKKAPIQLSFSLATGSAPELKHAAEMIRDQWQKIGARVDVQVFDIGDLNQNVIRPRKYDALFFGEVVGKDYDLFPFWHSSQRNDPGLNIALYTNIKADKLLESMRSTQNRDERITQWQQLKAILDDDVPAVFVYSPDFIYITPKTLHTTTPTEIVNSSERFAHVSTWYIDTNNVWKIFTH